MRTEGGPEGAVEALQTEAVDNYLAAICGRYLAKLETAAEAETIGDSVFLNLQGGLTLWVHQHEGEKRDD